MKKVLKVIGIIFGILFLILIGGYFILMTHTQIIVGFIQKASSKTVNTKNSYEPLREPYTGVKKNGQYVVADDYQKRIQEIADKEREKELKSRKVLYYSNSLDKKMENGGFGMVVRSGGVFRKIVKKYFEQYPDDTIMIYSMWSGYRSLDGVKEILEIAKNVETVHVSGHITKEDLEHVIDIVGPEKLMIHHTLSNDDQEKRIMIPIGTELVCAKDGTTIEL
jgi:ribonuclease J